MGAVLDVLCDFSQVSDTATDIGVLHTVAKRNMLEQTQCIHKGNFISLQQPFARANSAEVH